MRVLWRGKKFKLVQAPAVRLRATSLGGNLPPIVFLTLKETPLVRRGHHVVHAGRLTKTKLRELIAQAKEMES